MRSGSVFSTVQQRLSPCSVDRHRDSGKFPLIQNQNRAMHPLLPVVSLNCRTRPGTSAGFLESPFALRKKRIRNFRRAKGDSYFPLDAKRDSLGSEVQCAAIQVVRKSIKAIRLAS